MTARDGRSYLITCEHGGNRIPPAYRSLFVGRRALLDSHRGWDPGALRVARAFARALRAPLVASTTSRLLVDLNRSLGHPRHFSVATRDAPEKVRADIVTTHYLPYRARVERIVRRRVSRGERVIHVSAHSFTPVLGGDVRRAEVGLLYDPARRPEGELCAGWKRALSVAAPDLRVRRNYPYAGRADGLTSYLRRRFPPRAYVGIELEINQRIVRSAGRRWTVLPGVLIESFRNAESGDG